MKQPRPIHPEVAQKLKQIKDDLRNPHVERKFEVKIRKPDQEQKTEDQQSGKSE